MAVSAAGSISFERAACAREARVARLSALVLDVIVFGLITFIVNSVYGVTEVTSGFIAGNESYMTTTTAVAWPWLTLLGILYFAIPEAMSGATPGKHWMGVAVIRLDGRPLTIRDVMIRNLLRPIDFLPLLYLLGGVLVAATPGSQRIGDFAAGTTVAHRRRVPEFGATLTSTVRAKGLIAGVLLAALVFTAGFDYFGRPPLVVDGLFKQQELANPRLTDYSLGAPTWGFGTVSYPVRGHTATETCTGSQQLSWQWFGWTGAGGQLVCVPS